MNKLKVIYITTLAFSNAKGKVFSSGVAEATRNLDLNSAFDYLEFKNLV
jgi:hypothetical protein